MSVNYDLILDTVNGHEAVIGIGTGRISRMGLIKAKTLPFCPPSPQQMLNGLNEPGQPVLGDAYPHPDYADYFLKNVILKAFSATLYGMELIYEQSGLKVEKSTSSLSSVTTQIHPKDFSPLYVTWNNPADPAAKPVKKVANFKYDLPLRHLSISATVPIANEVDFTGSFGSVNNNTWRGLPVGYWLFSGLESYSPDDGVTWCYNVVLTTKVHEDWSELNFMVDDRGKPIIVPEADVTTLRNKPYSYGTDVTVNGLTKAGLYPTADFTALFGA